MGEDGWIDNHPARQDGARLQALNASRMHDALLKWHTKGIAPITHQKTLGDAKNKEEETTGLRTLKGVRALGIPAHLKDHMRCMPTGKTKCGAYWNNIPGYAFRSFCKNKEDIEVSENEQHMWLGCETNGRAIAWETTKGEKLERATFHGRR